MLDTRAASFAEFTVFRTVTATLGEKHIEWRIILTADFTVGLWGTCNEAVIIIIRRRRIIIVLNIFYSLFSVLQVSTQSASHKSQCSCSIRKHA